VKRRALKRRYGRSSVKRFTVDAGRQVLRDGKPFIGIRREGNTYLATADEVTHVIADCLNKKKFKGTYDK
jgi:hypothetical protein